MSGGSYDYAYGHVLNMADALERAPQTPIRKDFQALLGLVGAAMKAVERVDSGDRPMGDEDAPIEACFAFAAMHYDKVVDVKEAWAEWYSGECDCEPAYCDHLSPVRKALDRL